MLARNSAVGLALAAATLASGCGGGGGNGGPEEFQVVALRRDVAGNTVRSFSARYATLESGALRQGEGYSSETAAIAAFSDMPFAVDASRSLSATPPWGPAVAGRMSEDGVFAAATTASAPDEPSILLAIRRHPSPTLADLVGEWFVARYVRRPGSIGGSSVYCALSEGQISAAGTFLVTDEPDVNADGVVAGPPALSIFSSVVFDPGGWVLIDEVGASFRGGLSSDGSVLLLATAGPGDADVWVLFRRGLSSDTSEVSGSHVLAGFQRSGTAFASLAGVATFAGISGGSSSLVGNVDGSPTPPFFPDVGLFLHVSGKAILSLGPLSFVGASGPSGRYLAAIGGLSAGDEPSLHVFVRRPAARAPAFRSRPRSSSPREETGVRTAP
jgi:hypothetical protein